MCRDWHVTKTVNSASPRNPPPPPSPLPSAWITVNTVQALTRCSSTSVVRPVNILPEQKREIDRVRGGAPHAGGEGLGGIEVGDWGVQKKKSLFLISIYFYLFIYWLTPPPVTASNRRDERRCTVQTSDAFSQSSSWRNKQKQNLITAKCYFFI